jgi:hypothetical protein
MTKHENEQGAADIGSPLAPTARLYPLLGLPAKEGQKLLNIECRLCGLRARAAFPWHGRPQGPQCQCNPNTWGNWRRVDDGEV